MTPCRPGDPRRAALDAIQGEIAVVEQEIRTVATARHSDDELRAACRAWVAKRGDDRAPRRFDFLAFDNRPRSAASGPIEWPLYIALQGEDVVAEQLCALVSRRHPTPGLPREQRVSRDAELQARLRKLLRNEEFETLRLERDGLVIVRRPGADADALIELWSTETEFS